MKIRTDEFVLDFLVRFKCWHLGAEKVEEILDEAIPWAYPGTEIIIDEDGTKWYDITTIAHSKRCFEEMYGSVDWKNRRRS